MTISESTVAPAEAEPLVCGLTFEQMTVGQVFRTARRTVT